MPKRVIDFDAIWASDKIAACAEWAQAEYAWLYGLADCCGCFELTNLRVIWGRVAAVRRNLSLERLEQVFDEFHDKGLLFRWNENGKRYGHWTGSDVPGRLPPPSWRNRLERLAPPVPAEQLAKYLGGDAGRLKERAAPMADVREIKLRVDVPQAQGLDLDQEGNRDVERLTPVLEMEKSVREGHPIPIHENPLLGKGQGRSEAQEINPAGEKPQVSARTAGDLSYTPTNSPGSGNPGYKVKLDVEKPQVSARTAGDLSYTPANSPGSGSPGYKGKLDVEKPQVSARTAGDLSYTPANSPGSGSPGYKGKLDVEKPQVSARTAGDLSYKDKSTPAGATPETLARIWEQERGSLPELRGLTAERAARCRERIVNARMSSHDGSDSSARFLCDFREAVRRAARTPFLTGAGPAGWRANFDWIVANDTNYLKVLEGRYDSGAGAGNAAGQLSARDESARREIYAGAGPEVAAGSVRVRAGVMERAMRRG
jgi:hypothetical protein